MRKYSSKNIKAAINIYIGGASHIFLDFRRGDDSSGVGRNFSISGHKGHVFCGLTVFM